MDKKGKDVAATIGLFGTFCCIAKHHSILVKRVVCTKYYTVYLNLCPYTCYPHSILSQAQKDLSYSRKSEHHYDFYTEPRHLAHVLMNRL